VDVARLLVLQVLLVSAQHIMATRRDRVSATAVENVLIRKLK